MTLIKICGNRTVEDALAAAAAGADFIGIVFAPSSRRRVDPLEARAITRALGEPLAAHEISVPPPMQHDGDHADEAGYWFAHGRSVVEHYLGQKRPLIVGVFADQPIEEVNEIAEEAALDLVQLSGGEPWEACLLATRQAVQVLHVDVDTGTQNTRAPLDVRAGYSLAVMLDAAVPGARGGTGQRFEWSVAAELGRRIPIFLAGGLTPENVGDAIRVAHPWVVDVSSGTETDGTRDPARVRSFIEAVRAADAEIGQ